MTDLADRSVAADKEVDMTLVAKNEEEKAKKDKPKKAQKEKKEKPPQMKKKLEDAAEIGITVGKEDDLAMWYQQILVKGEFLEYSDIPGCYIINVRHEAAKLDGCAANLDISQVRTLSGKASRASSIPASRNSACATATSPSSSPKPICKERRTISRASRPR